MSPAYSMGIEWRHLRRQQVASSLTHPRKYSRRTMRGSSRPLAVGRKRRPPVVCKCVRPATLVASERSDERALPGRPARRCAGAQLADLRAAGGGRSQIRLLANRPAPTRFWALSRGPTSAGWLRRQAGFRRRLSLPRLVASGSGSADRQP